MSNTTETTGVNAGPAPAEELVEVTLHLPVSVWDRIKEMSVAELITTDEVVANAVEGFTPDAEDDGTAPMFFSEQVVRYVREFCGAAGVDADEWAESWIMVHLNNALETGPSRKGGNMILEGILGDILHNYELESVTREDAEKAMLDVLERYRAEIGSEEPQREAAASTEGGEG
jgi:hypothetical protein